MPGPLNPEAAARERLGPVKAGRVLDVATGGGGFILRLAPLFAGYASFTGIDLREEPLVAARKAFADGPGRDVHDVEFARMDAAAMTFPDDSFDTATVANSLHHLPDPGQVLREMKRVTRPGGLLVIAEMFRDGQAETQLTHVLMHDYWGELNTIQGQYHRPSFTRAEIVELVDGAGLEHVDRFETSDLSPDPLDPEGIEFLCRRNRELLEPLRGHPDFARLETRCTELEARARRVGFHSATQLWSIGRVPA
jgi:SAM-dependent methyltransferase